MYHKLFFKIIVVVLFFCTVESSMVLAQSLPTGHRGGTGTGGSSVELKEIIRENMKHNPQYAMSILLEGADYDAVNIVLEILSEDDETLEHN